LEGGNSPSGDLGRPLISPGEVPGSAGSVRFLSPSFYEGRGLVQVGRALQSPGKMYLASRRVYFRSFPVGRGRSLLKPFGKPGITGALGNKP